MCFKLRRNSAFELRLLILDANDELFLIGAFPRAHFVQHLIQNNPIREHVRSLGISAVLQGL